MEDIEDAVFRLHDFLNGGGGKDEEGLELAQMEEAHEGVDVRGIQEDASDGCVGGATG